jgi:hypothetical protein
LIDRKLVSRPEEGKEENPKRCLLNAVYFFKAEEIYGELLSN